MRACSRPTCRWRSTCFPTSCPSRLSTAKSSLREQNVIVQEIGAVADTPDDLIFEHLQAIAFPDQPLGRSILGTPKTVRSFDGAQAARLSRAALPRARHGGRRGRRGRSRGGGRRGRAALCELQRAGQPGCRSRRGSAAAATSRSASSSRSISRWRCPACALTDPSLYSLQVFTNVLGGGMSSRLFQEAREKRGLCYSIYSFHVPYSDTGMFGLYAGTDAADTSELMRVIVDEIAEHGRDHLRAGGRARQGADEGRPVDGAGKLRRPHRAAGAPDDRAAAGRSRSRSWSKRSTRSRSRARAPPAAR